MLALILAGGSGSRLSLGEKPLVMVDGVPMIERIIRAFEKAGCEVVVVLSPRTPFTRNWCMAHDILHYCAAGTGYVEDIVETVEALGKTGSLFTCVSDIPCIRPETIEAIQEKHFDSGKDACSVWVPLSFYEKNGCRASYVQEIDGIECCPAGINILNGSRITEPQEEIQILVNDYSLAFNINTREELSLVRQFFQDEEVDLSPRRRT